MKLFFILLFLCHIVAVKCDVHNTTDSQIGQVGVTALWVGVVSHSFSALAYVIASKRCKESNQIYYHINIIICSIATTCYFLMAMRQSDYVTEDGHLVLWARYLEFLIGTPLLLLDLCMIINLPTATMFYICFMDILMIGAGWFATISTTNIAKWGLFILGCIFFYPILDAVLGFTPVLKNNDSNSGHNRFVILYTAVVWNGYAILWILHDGFGWVSLDTECVMHTVLDILAKDLFGVVLLYNHIENDRDIPPSTDDSSIASSPPASPRMYEMGERRPDTQTIRRSSTGPPVRIHPVYQGIRRSTTGPHLQRDPQIIVTPPLIRRERENAISDTHRRPSVPGDHSLTMTDDGDHRDFDNVSTSSRDTRRDASAYRDDTYDATVEIDELQSLRTRSPSPRPRDVPDDTRNNLQSLQSLPRSPHDTRRNLPLHTTHTTHTMQRLPRPQHEDDTDRNLSSRSQPQHTPEYEDDNFVPSNDILPSTEPPASPSRQNVLNRAIQTFDRIRQMI